MNEKQTKKMATKIATRLLKNATKVASKQNRTKEAFFYLEMLQEK